MLVIDPSEPYLDFMRILLGSEGYRAATARSGSEAWHQLAREQPSLVITELRLGTLPAHELLQLLTGDGSVSRSAVLICTADASLARQLTPVLKRTGAAVLLKPFDIDELLGWAACLISGPAHT